MKLINRLDEMFDRLMGKEIFYRDSTIKEVISQIINKDIDELNSREEVYILLKAMVNAAKSDGEIDEDEQRKIMEYMGDMSKVEKIFVEYELKKSLDIKAFIKEIPKGMEQQVYYMSLFTIDLDNTAESDYLEVLANKLNLTFNVVNNIHESLEAKIA